LGERLASHHCYLLPAGPQCCVDRLRSPPQSGHSRFTIAAMQLDPKPHFVDRKSLL